MGTERAGYDANIGFWNPRDVHPIMDKGIQGRLNKWGSWRVGKESRIWAWFPHHLPSVLSHYSFLFFVRETDKPIITNSLFRPELLEHRASWSRFLLLDQAAQLPWPSSGICSSFPRTPCQEGSFLSFMSLLKCLLKKVSLITHFI